MTREVTGWGEQKELSCFREREEEPGQNRAPVRTSGKQEAVVAGKAV